jgi:hypothetical protein
LIPEPPTQKIDIAAFDAFSFESLLVDRPPIRQPERLQLHYLKEYLSDLHCRAVLTENHYIDRDYMEDHSVFYSRNLYPYPNACKRAHFFSRISSTTVRSKLSSLARIARKGGREAYQLACRRFSEKNYLGFAVIKPLPGSPIGRTVLRTYGPQADSGFRRLFPCTSVYPVHLLGTQLTVRGLGFQQQDVGVSACATTALWSALQKVREYEPVGPATPAQITKLAAQYALPFGRSMPSEGLSLDQMCQAIQALYISPNLVRTHEYENARALIYSTILSQLPPILILEATHIPDFWHAVTAVGLKLHPAGSEGSRLIAGGLYDRAADLASVYIHDDRIGPYLRADLTRNGAGAPSLTIFPQQNAPEEWTLTHVLTPVHSKIRLSVPDLRDLALDLVKEVLSSTSDPPQPWLSFEVLAMRSHEYAEDSLSDATTPQFKTILALAETIPLSRYVGVIRLTNQKLGEVDVLVDTTSTAQNLNVSAVHLRRSRGIASRGFAKRLADACSCPLIGAS